MKKSASPAGTFSTPGQATEANADSESEMASRMDDTSADDGALSPIESAILCMDKDLQQATMFLKEIKNHMAMLETAIKLSSYELGEIRKFLKQKE